MALDKSTVGKISILFAVAIPLLLFSCTIFSDSWRDYFWVKGPWFIFGAEFIALLLGLVAWSTPVGKRGVFLSVLISVLLFGYLSISGVSTIEGATSEVTEVK
nr:hypothetical protein [uncultured Undibacterium sp.]